MDGPIEDGLDMLFLEQGAVIEDEELRGPSCAGSAYGERVECSRTNAHALTFQAFVISAVRK